MDNQDEFDKYFDDMCLSGTVDRDVAREIWEDARSDAYLLRKQAEAVEACWHSDCREIPELDEKALLREDMLDAVRSLRQQADEAENE